MVGGRTRAGVGRGGGGRPWLAVGRGQVWGVAVAVGSGWRSDEGRCVRHGGRGRPWLAVVKPAPCQPHHHYPTYSSIIANTLSATLRLMKKM